MIKKVCPFCGSYDVYCLELRTDYNHFSDISPYNDSDSVLVNSDLPYRISIDYCHSCLDIIPYVVDVAVEDLK